MQNPSHFVEHAAAATTYGGAVSAFSFWGLHLSDIGVILSSCASLAGLALQIWVARWRVKAAREQIAAHQEIDSGATEN